ncbi:MAG: terpene cyclase/mutase family protein [Parcubacteria group bacterium]|nr:terpene cyclase/mutase family protein [Parcubacteria group bacterium]
MLFKAGFRADARIVKDLSFILTRQESDGSFAGSEDMTAAAIQTLSLFQGGRDDVNGAIGRAKQYLKLRQEQGGGFENAYTAAWVLQAISALKEVPQDWAKEEKTPLGVLSGFQREDGSVGADDETVENRIWATAYAIPAALGKSWGDVLTSFDIPAVVEKATAGEAIKQAEEELIAPKAATAESPEYPRGEEYERLSTQITQLRSEVAELKNSIETRTLQQESVAKPKNLVASLAYTAIVQPIVSALTLIWKLIQK